MILFVLMAGRDAASLLYSKGHARMPAHR